MNRLVWSTAPPSDPINPYCFKLFRLLPVLKNGATTWLAGWAAQGGAVFRPAQQLGGATQPAHTRYAAAAECGTWRWARSKGLAAARCGFDTLKCFIVLSFAPDEKSSRPAPQPDPNPIPSPKDMPLGFWFWQSSQHPRTSMSGVLQSQHPRQREPAAGNVRR